MYVSESEEEKGVESTKMCGVNGFGAMKETHRDGESGGRPSLGRNICSRHAGERSEYLIE